MNENLNLVEILKDCPKGAKLYSTIYGEVKLYSIEEKHQYPIIFTKTTGYTNRVTADGRHLVDYNGECTLFPSKDQRDWSKFTAPWYKKEKFDPKTFKPYENVLVRDSYDDTWRCRLFSHIIKHEKFPYMCGGNAFVYCIPYNDDTKHLVGTTKEAPEYYRYWEE